MTQPLPPRKSTTGDPAIVALQSQVKALQTTVTQLQNKFQSAFPGAIPGELVAGRIRGTAAPGTKGSMLLNFSGGAAGVSPIELVSDGTYNRVQIGNLAAFTDGNGVVSAAEIGLRVLDANGDILLDSGLGRQTWIGMTNPTGTSTTISSIPQGYSTMVISASGQTSNAAAQALALTVNSDASADYATAYLDYTAAAVVNGGGAGVTHWTPGSFSTSTLALSGLQVVILGYSNATAMSMTFSDTYAVAGPTQHVVTGGGAWAGTGPITSITLALAAGNFTNARVTVSLLA